MNIGQNLPTVGKGPAFYAGRTQRVGIAKRRLDGTEYGAEVDVLLDDGRIVRTTLRAPYHGHADVVFVVGIVGGYGVWRVAPPGKFKGVDFHYDDAK